MADANSRPIDAPRTDDAFGEMVWDYFTDDLAERPQYRRDDGDVTEAHLDIYFSEPEEWPSEFENTLSSLDGPVLDVGCGVGQHARFLQDQGRDVFAIDRSPGAIAVARERGVEHAAVMDIHDLSILQNTFESIIVIGKQIAVGNSLEDLRETLSELAAATASGGQLVADFNTVERREDGYLDDHWIDDGAAYRRFRVEYDDLVGPWVDVMMIEPDTLEGITAETVWDIVDTVGPEGDDSEYLVTFERR